MNYRGGYFEWEVRPKMNEMNIKNKWYTANEETMTTSLQIHMLKKIFRLSYWNYLYLDPIQEKDLEKK